MAGQQTLARDLLAAGTTLDPKDNVKYQLVVDPTESSLSLQTWKGENLDGDELVAESVRPNSTATLLLTPSGKMVICITTSSKLAAYKYDDDESEWVELKGHPVSTYAVHRNGKVSSTTSPTTGKTVVVFQDATGQIAYLDNDWKLNPAPVSAVDGSPISILGNEHQLLIFYISSKDNFVHAAARQEGSPWLDSVAIQYAFKEEVKSFLMGDQDAEAFVLTGKNALIKVSGDGKKTSLGTIKDGKFVPATSEENVMSMSYSNGGFSQWQSSSGNGGMWQTTTTRDGKTWTASSSGDGEVHYSEGPSGAGPMWQSQTWGPDGWTQSWGPGSGQTQSSKGGKGGNGPQNQGSNSSSGAGPMWQSQTWGPDGWTQSWGPGGGQTQSSKGGKGGNGSQNQGSNSGPQMFQGWWPTPSGPGGWMSMNM